MADQNNYTFEVMPLYAQVYLMDSSVENFPEITTESKQFVFNENMIIIFTQPDTKGDVEVSIGAIGENPSEELIYKAKINFSSGIAQVGSIVASDLYNIRLAQPGVTDVEVYVSPLHQPSRVKILFPVGAVASIEEDDSD